MYIGIAAMVYLIYKIFHHFHFSLLPLLTLICNKLTVIINVMHEKGVKLTRVYFVNSPSFSA